MHNRRRGVQRNSISLWQGDEVTSSLDTKWFRNPERLPYGVHSAELALHQKRAHHPVIEKVEDGKDELW